jgi:hypothetical protein
MLTDFWVSLYSKCRDSLHKFNYNKAIHFEGAALLSTEYVFKTEGIIILNELHD